MPLDSAAVQTLVTAVPQQKFLSLPPAGMEMWIEFVATANEPTTHGELFYASVARALAEQMGSSEPADYADSQMRQFIIDGIRMGITPFQEDPEGPWKEVKFTPAHITAALKVQACASKAEKQTAEVNSVPGATSEGLAQAIEALAKATKERDLPKKEYLTFNLKDRLVELGLDYLPKDMLPSEEALIRLERASKVAR